MTDDGDAPLPTGLPYDVVGVVGRGTSSVVYRARHVTHRGEVALKLYHGPLCERVRARFRRECELQWSLSDHPNVVRLLDASAPDTADAWIVMPLCDFSLAGGTTDAATALDWAADVLRGLAAVHDAGLLHRDIKPGNVLVKDGTAALSDFGLALDHDDQPTEYGSGTPGYRAPELLTGSAPTRRSDVFSAAVTLRSLLGTTVPDAVDDLLTRASSYDPTDRPADGRALLEDFARATGAAAHPPGPRHARVVPAPIRPGRPAGRRHAAWLPVAVGVLLTAIVGSALVLRPGGDDAGALPDGPVSATSRTGSPAATGSGVAGAALPELAQLPPRREPDWASTDGGPRTTILFENRTAARVNVVWLDQQGRRRTYARISPGDSTTVRTFVGHPWLVADAEGVGQFVVLPQPGPARATVS